MKLAGANETLLSLLSVTHPLDLDQSENQS